MLPSESTRQNQNHLSKAIKEQNRALFPSLPKKLNPFEREIFWMFVGKPGELWWKVTFKIWEIEESTVSLVFIMYFVNSRAV